MESLVLVVLQILQSLIAQLGSSNTAVNQILAGLIQIVPIVVNLGPAIINSVKAIISALENSGALTDAELATLASLSAELDTAWASTVAAYNASKGLAPAAVAAEGVLPSTPAPADTTSATVEPVGFVPLAPSPGLNQ